MKIRIGKRLEITTGKARRYPVTKTEKTLGLYGWDSENKAMKGPKYI
jgi:hypothetical protein